MAKESVKARQRKRERMVAQYAEKREALKAAGDYKPGFDQRPDVPTTCGPWSDCADQCVNRAIDAYPNPSRYCLFGPNSNSFTGTIERQCPVKPPPPSEVTNAPGYFDGPARGAHHP